MDTKNKEVRKCLKTIEVKLKGEIYTRLYDIQNVQLVVDLVNGMFENEIFIKIVDHKITIVVEE